MQTNLNILNFHSLDEINLWGDIKNHEIDDSSSSFKFSHRLERENLWSQDYTRRVIDEYKKFMFLGVVAGPVTPSLEVDQCWHLHMIYTIDYWELFCKNILKKEFHHGPTKGGKKEDDKFVDYYEKTLDSYRNYFGEPPVDIWPPSQIRFRNVNFVTVDLNDHWIIPAGDIKSLWKLLIKQIKSKFL